MIAFLRTKHYNAIEIDPNLHISWLNKGTAFLYLQNYFEAVDSFDRALEIKPDYCEACHNRGVAMQNSERSHEAISCYEKALEIDSSYELAKLNLAVVRLKIINS